MGEGTLKHFFTTQRKSGDLPEPKQNSGAGGQVGTLNETRPEGSGQRGGALCDTLFICDFVVSEPLSASAHGKKPETTPD